MSLPNSVGFYNLSIKSVRKKNENIGIVSTKNDSVFRKLLGSGRVRSMVCSEREPVELNALF